MNEPAQALPFSLTDQERVNPLWVRLMGHFEDRLAKLRVRNDAPHDEVATASLRGEIRALRTILALNKQRSDDPDL